ncbi:MAG TPA: DUF2142 domain-containing protein [Candidatus Saccharimonadales bacterium]
MKIQTGNKSLSLKTRILKIGAAPLLFLVTSLLSGLFFVYNVPIGYGNDEGVHVLKASAISYGDIFSDPLGKGTTPEGNEVTTYGVAAHVDIANLEHASGPARKIAECDPQSFCTQPSPEIKDKIQDLAGADVDESSVTFIDLMGANIYNPIAYIPSAAFIKIGNLLDLSAGNIVMLARLGSLLAFIVLSFWAIYLLRNSRAKWIVFCIALMPGSIVAAASVGVDSVLNGIALLVFALIIRVFTKEGLSTPLRIVLITGGLLLPLLKLPYAIISMAILFLPIYPSALKGWLTRFGLGTAMLLPALYWTIVTSGPNTTQSLWVHAGSTPPNTHDQIMFIISHPIAYLESLIKTPLVNDWAGGLGALTHQVNLQLPSLLLLFGFLLTLLAAWMAVQDISSRHKKRFNYLMFAVPTLSVLGIASALYVAFNPVGAEIIEGVQGRYFFPILPFIAIAVALLIPVKLSLQHLTRLFAAGNIAILLLTCFWYFSVVY